ncbi:MAG TPA: hypothetical protein VG841_06220 [Caulobacterales bacterium]|nr:hypothetical protein [Caulobacterales bacterium]
MAPLNRLDDWTNDDLLLTQAARNQLEAQYKGSLLVFDWPDLRNAFLAIDNRATQSRKRRQRNGIIAVSIASLGAATGAWLPLVEVLGFSVERWWFALAVLFSLIGFVATLWITLVDRHRSEWLHNRLRTERFRQLYFQFMAHDPALGALALKGDPKALAEWSARRDNAFALVAPSLLGPVRKSLTALIDDVNHRHVWLYPPANRVAAAPVRTGEVDEFFEILHRQRIDVQNDYIREKLADGVSSPRTWHTFVQTTSYVMALAALGLSLLASYLLFSSDTFQSVHIRVLTSLIAIVGVVAIYIKLIGDGLQVRADMARYLWYRDALTEIERQFADPDPGSRVRVLRDMEHISYRELREFLKTHYEARFSFG